VPVDELNPFSKVYDALWALALRSPVFVDKVKPGNRVSYSSDTNRNPMKENLITNDMPEVALVLDGLSSGNLHASSSTSQLTRRYTFIVTTGDYRINYALLPLQWALICALAGWKETLGNLTWHGAGFVKRANITSIVEGESDSRRIAGTKGYTALWSCDVEMHFATAHLLEELQG